MTQRIAVGESPPRFSFNTAREQGLDFYREIKGRKTVLLFLRYAGCPLCQFKIVELMQDMERFRALGAQVFVVLQSEPASVRAHLGERDMASKIICDPQQALFRLYGVGPGNVFQYLTASVLKKAWQAKRRGFSHGMKEGLEMQCPATFIINSAGVVRFVHYGRDIGDVPENAELLERLASM